MPSQPFQPTFSVCRMIEIPTALESDVRKRFVARIKEAVGQQVELSRSCDAILKLTGEVREEGDHLVVAHERAAPAVAASIMSEQERPDIQTMWWLTWSTARALKVAAEQKITHGGIQFACVYRDETGRVKLGDFGIAQAYESVCGVDSRRYVACTCQTQADPSGRVPSGVWSLLDEQTRRDSGWIAPYFGHELLEGRTRLNPKSDQFALGALLFLWATGNHPYGVELSDPNQMIYFQLEPYPLEDERPDWADAFERAETDVQTSADQKILSWRDLTTRLLASEPKDRFESLDECIQLVGTHGDETSWSAASEAISAAIELLDAGDVNSFIERIRPHSDGDSLPALWRDTLSGYVQHAEAQKEAIARRKAMEKRLREGNAALEQQNIGEARAIAQEVHEAPDADDEMRSSADALAALCDEHETLIKSGAAELARQNIEQSRAAMDRNDLSDARQYAEMVKRDTSAPASFKTQAEGMLAEIAEAEKRVSHYLAELTQATIERREGQIDSPRQRINDLLADERLPESVAAQARLLLKDLQETERHFSGYSATLDEARSALEQLDEVTSKSLLDALPPKKLPEALRARCDELRERLSVLSAALKVRRSAEALLDENKPADARDAAAQALATPDIPKALREELTELVVRCETVIAEAEQAARAQILDALENAAACLEQLQLDRCAELLDSVVLPSGILPDEARRRAETLRASCDAAATATAALDRTQRAIQDGDFDAADTALSEAATADLPGKLAERSSELASQIEKARAAVVAQRRDELRKRLDQAAAAVDAGDIAAADELLGRVEPSPYLTDEMRETVAVVRAEIEKFRPVLDTIAEAETALSEHELGQARELTIKLPRDINWVAKIAVDLERRIEQAQAAERQAALAAVEKGLAAAQDAVDRLDPAAALVSLGEVEADLKRRALQGPDAAGFKDRAGKITAEAKTLQAWLPKVRTIEQLVEGGDLARAYRDATALAKQDGVPEPIAQRVNRIADDVKKQIAARQEQIKSELSAVAADIEKRKRRAKQVVERLAAVTADALAAKVQKSQAAELLKQFEALPVPKAPIVPIGIGVGLVSVAAAIVFVMTRPPTAAQRLETALEGLRASAAAAVSQQTGPPLKSFTLKFRPNDLIPSNLFAKIESSASDLDLDLGTFDDEDITRATLTTAQTDQLTAALQPTLQERMASALAAITQQAQLAATEAHGPKFTRFRLYFRPPNQVPTALFAQIDGQENDLRIGEFTNEDIDRGTLEPAQLQLLLAPLRPMEAPVRKADIAALRQEAREAAVNAHGTPRAFTLEIVPTDAADGQSTDGELFLTVAGERHSLGKLTDANPPADWLNQVVALSKPRDMSTPIQAEVDRFNTAVEKALGRGDVTYQPITISDLSARAVLGKRNLLPVTLAHDKDGFSPAPEQVARHFALQADALAALSSDAAVQVTMGEPFGAYAGGVTFVDASGTATVASVDLPGERVTIAVAARLKADKRDAVSFELSGTFSGTSLTVDDAGRRAFAGYLDSLQKASIPTPPTTIGKSPVPAGVAAGKPTRTQDSLKIDLLGPGGTTIAALNYTWRPATLTYEMDQAAADADIRTWMRTQVTTSGLKPVWRKVREAVAPAAGSAGAGYVRGSELIEVAGTVGPGAVGHGGPTPPFVVNVDLTIGPGGAPADDIRNLRVPWRLGLGPDGIAFDLATSANVKTALQTQIAAKASDEKFRTARAQDAVAALAGKPQSVEPPKIDAMRAPITLTADVTQDGKGHRFRWSWDAAALGFAGAEEIPLNAAAATLARLADLAQMSEPDAVSFVAALVETAQIKCDALSPPPAGRYKPSGLLADKPQSAEAALTTLRDVSHSLQKLIAANPQFGTLYPLVFVEYLVQNDQAYGLGWIATVDPNSEEITGVSELMVWPITSLPATNDGPGLTDYHAAYSTSPEIGNQLLPIIPKVIAASAGGAWGLVVAPDGPLWAVRWSQVKFDPRTFDPGAKLKWTGPPAPNQPAQPEVKSFATIGDLFAETTHDARNNPLHPRVGIWSVPSIGGTFQRRSGRKKLDLGLSGFSMKWRPVSGFAVLIVAQDANFNEAEWNTFSQGRSVAKKLLDKNFFGQQFWLNNWADTQGVWNFSLIQGQQP